jgi:hypothetical protein
LSQQHRAPLILPAHEWAFNDRIGRRWLISTILVGSILGYIVGEGFPSGYDGDSIFRRNLARSFRSTSFYVFFTSLGDKRDLWWHEFIEWGVRLEQNIEAEHYTRDPAHPRVFAVLREAVVRESGGYVHPDLGTMHPAPCGSIRGLGMVRESYTTCQRHCFPGTYEERLNLVQQYRNGTAIQDPGAAPNGNTTAATTPKYPQEEVLLRIPLKFQITRTVAWNKLSTLIPADVQTNAGMLELDDAILLALFLAHERGVGKFSRWLPYIASLPPVPTCGFNPRLYSYLLDALEAYRDELNVDTNGWAEELLKATIHAERIIEALNADYGSYIQNPPGVSPLGNIQWALCQVASRATAGSRKHGSLRLIPMLDLINHDAEAGGFVELRGNERIDQGDFVDAVEDDSGTIVVRSLRHGRRRALRKGQELLVNYNVPHYAPLDWLVNMAFVPRERWEAWQKVDAVLPQVRRDGPFVDEKNAPSLEEMLQLREEKLLHHLRNADL